ncbi:methyltransferase family protein [Synechococcus sp. PCC 7502]|uniref:class I SAM-dependent methyltransferase n=1 Tax=Synechococcus sp. PCC 7502 TaxID=1173263 RepID=UPI00029F8E33|nr:class I SAM-dependent methyltransferase [Synechococcus sp. PCC 7502]AFY72376.1 methyltransferase family protein [Synechococcus sp. PCC 7502]
MPDRQAVTNIVSHLYDTFPFPPDPLLDEAPPGYNWRWSWQGAFGFCTNGLAATKKPRILDAGCGSGVSTEYLAHLNPNADIVAIDISAGTLEVAKERCRRSSPPMTGRSLTFQQLSLYDLDQIAGQFDMINSVGVLHHLPDPIAGIQAVANKLAPGGIFHVFVYAKIGRWEINLMQQAIALLQTQGQKQDFRAGVKLGREVFAALPDTNRLVQREKNRWAMENTRDECFADMYLHPQEIDYEIGSLFELIAASGLEFVGFSNPHIWNLERLLGSNPELLALAQSLPIIDQYRLIELLDTDIAHYEFFLARPPLAKLDQSDARLLSSIPQHHPCINGWESDCLFDPDYGICHLSELEFKFMQQCQYALTVSEILKTMPELSLEVVRSLLNKRVILLQQF